ncbi:unnamed protein product, partial [Prorocentrum cordatum]
VLPDWLKSGLRVAGAVSGRSDIIKYVGETVDRFLDRKDRMTAKELKKRKLPEMIPNREMALAIDHGLKSAGLSLEYFIPKVKMAPLAANEIRYIIELPEDRRVPGTSRFRSCITNKDNGPTRVELPRQLNWAEGCSSLHSPSLHKSFDEGSIGLPMTHWMDCFLGVRGASIEDKWHRFWNDMKGALIENDLWSVISERTVVFNMMTAPFGHHKFFTEISEDICAEKGMLDDFGIGTENHKEYVWNMVKNSIAWSIKGSRVKIGRSASWINANREWRGKKMEVLLVLVYIGMLHGWWKSLDGVPITPSAMKILE